MSSKYFLGPNSKGKITTSSSIESIRGFCTSNAALKASCHSNYIPNGIIKIPFNNIKGKTYKKCAGDLIKSPRYAKICKRKELSKREKKHLDCATGVIEPSECEPEMLPYTPSSDDFMTQYCLKLENITKEVCSCLRKQKHRDKTCGQGNKGIYKTKAQFEYQNKSNEEEETSNKEEDNAWGGYNWLIPVFLVVIILGGLFLMIGDNKPNRNNFYNGETIRSKYPQDKIDRIRRNIYKE